MKYIVIYELLIILIFLVVFYKLNIDLKNKSQRIVLLEQQVNQNYKQTKTQPIIKNQRKNHRIHIFHENIDLTLINCKPEQFQKLIGKKITGNIEDISLSGIKMVSEYNLPIKGNFETQTSFSIKDNHFTINALLVRKEEHVKEDLITYGIEFLKLDHETEKQLAVSLHKIEAERKNHIS